MLRTAKTASFVLVPWNDLTFIKKIPRWDESIIKEMGCTYTTQDPVHIANLIGILEHADIKKAGSEAEFISTRNGEFMMSGANQAIYLTLTDGTEAKFLLVAVLNSNIKTALGQFTKAPEFKNFPLSANRSLTRSLVQWAVEVGNPDASGPKTAHELDAQWAADRRTPEARKDYIEFWCKRYTTERSSYE